ncbi:MAG TPA: DUF481 domain-containing protein [Ignavibacteriaceae bacterium]
MQLRQIIYPHILIIIFLVLNSKVYAQKEDVVILNNGDKITGEIKYLRVGILNFKTDNMETISIQWDKVKSISTKNFYEIQLDDGREYFGSIEPSGEEGILLLKGITIDTKLFMKYMIRIERIKDSFWDILDGYIKFGFSYTKANEIGQLSVGGNARYRTKINFTELNLNSVITTTENEASSRKQELSFSYQQNFEDRWFAAGLANIESNSELGIKLRASLGGGIGNNLIQSGHQWLYTLAGALVNREWLEDESTPTYNVEGLLNAQYQFFKYDHPKASLLTYIYLLPSLTEFGRFRMSYNIQLSWEIFIDFYWDLTFYFDYDNKPQSEGASHSDYRIDNSIKYEF